MAVHSQYPGFAGPIVRHMTSTPGEAGGTFFEISYCKNAKMWYHTCERRTLLDGGGSRR